jgi:hypothetical protein
VDRVPNGRPGVRRQTADRFREAVAWLDKATVRPAIISSLAADTTLDIILAGQAGFANGVHSRELRQVAEQDGLTWRTAYPRRMDARALAQERIPSIAVPVVMAPSLAGCSVCVASSVSRPLRQAFH